MFILVYYLIMKILFLNHKIKSCGVYQYGLRLYDILKKSTQYTYIYCEVENYQEYIGCITSQSPHCIIYNYHRATMHWLNQTTIYKSGINIGVPHETNETMFDYVLTIDPNETETDKKFNIPRPIFEEVDSIISNTVIQNSKIKTFIECNEGEDVPIFGSFGFGFHNKGFEKIIEEVNKQYNRAIIKLLITFAHFDSNREANIRDIVNRCESIERKSGIKLIITHEFFTNEEILMFLSSNTCNIFLYDTSPDRGEVVGISSVIDYAISVNVPFIISDSIMFRNIYSDSICVYKTPIFECIKNSEIIGEKFRNKYSNKNLIEKVDKIVGFSSMPKMRGIFYNSQRATCSIYESGLMVYNCLKSSPFFSLEYTENRNFLYEYDFAIVNYHDVVNFWVNEEMMRQFNKPVYCIVTEVDHREDVISRSPKFFTGYIVLDSSISDIRNIYGFPRPLESHNFIPYIKPSIPIIGSFGFATGGKRWDLIIEQVQKEFDEAIIRFNIPYATHIPDNQSRINDIITKCNSVLIPDSKIKLEITHNNFTREELINWCAQNTINCFFYYRNQIHYTGLCATADQSIIAERPLLVTGDNTFRHIHKYINHYPNITIKEAIEKTLPGVLQMKSDWSALNFCNKFEKILQKDFSQILEKKNKNLIFGFEVSAYYYTENYRKEGNVTKKIMELFEEFKSTGKNAFDINNKTFGDTISGYLKYLYINFKKKDYSVELKQQEGVTISWNNIISFIEYHISKESELSSFGQVSKNAIDVSIGEIIDKYSILELKLHYISDEKKREDIKHEMQVLESHVIEAKKSPFYRILVNINDCIWKNTDKIKAIGDFDMNLQEFARISHAIFEDNQRRFRLKKYFNNIFSSEVREHKSYSENKCFNHVENESEIYSHIPELTHLFVSYDVICFANKWRDIITGFFGEKSGIEFNESSQYKIIKLSEYVFQETSREDFDFAPIKYKSAGKMGDYLNQLSVICENYYKTGRKGELYIYNLANPGDHFGYGLEYAYKDTYSIISSLPYISKYSIYNGEDIDIDLSSWRNTLKKMESEFSLCNWNIIYETVYGIKWGSHPWISSQYDSKWKHKIIINNPGYRSLSPNCINNIRNIINKNREDCIFISNEPDHYINFSKLIGIHVGYYKPKDFEETVVMINSCEYGIFGFSSFAVIANGLHKPHYLIGAEWDDSYKINRMKGFMPNILDIFV